MVRILIIAMVAVLCSCHSQGIVAEDKIMKLEVTSTAFNQGDMIPQKYSCKGSNISPPLSWKNVPTAAKTIAIIADDPDAPMGTWIHWVLYNLPANMVELPEAVPIEKKLGNGASQGINTSGGIGYEGPCPPSGTHRYFFKLYALDTELTLDSSVTKAQLLDAMKGHVLSEGELMGRFSHK